MDLPATQAIDEDEIASTQKFLTDENNENILVATLQINNVSHSIVSGVTAIGRSIACNITIDDETVSKKHAEIEAESVDRSIFIRDLNSTNKTKINNTKLRPNSNYQIMDGDKLTFGKVVGLFKLFHPIDDSFVSCTPQVNKKIRPIIPGTPDSSMVSGSSSKRQTKVASTTNTTGLTIIRSKRTMTASADDTQNQPPKRTKTHDDLFKLPNVSVVISPLNKKNDFIRFKNRFKVINDNAMMNFKQPNEVNSSPVSERKRVIKVPKALDNFVMTHKSKSRNESSDLSAIDISIDGDKNSTAGSKSSSRNTRSKDRIATRNKKTNADNSSTSMENLVEKDSNKESEVRQSRTRSRSSKRNQSTVDLSRAKSGSNEDISKNSIKSDSTKRIGGNVRQNLTVPDLKKSETVVNKKSRSTRQNRSRDKSSESVFSESSDNDKEKNLSIMKTRQTRKRPATVVVEDSSDESQETAKTLENKAKQNVISTRTRRGQAVNKKNLNSEDSQGSVDNSKSDVDSFEKPVNRAKRARLNRSTKNKSVHQDETDEDSKVEESPKASTSRLKKTSSPLSSSIASSSVLLTPLRNTSRRSISISSIKGPKHKILFTGEKSEAHRKIVTKLGGTETDDLKKCSILVSDKMRRTLKLLCCLALGIPIVREKWLIDSDKANHFLDWRDYILNDPMAETQYKFKLTESLEKAKKKKLFEGYTILLMPQIKQPPIPELKEMIIFSGGKTLLRAPRKWPEKFVVVTNKEDIERAKKHIAKAPKSVTIQSLEFILTGILRQEINFEEFKLSA